MGTSVKQPKRAALASFVGTTIEWYDFYSYATAAAIVFGPLFFPGENRFVSLLASFGSFAVGFFARPVGGVLFGYLGDRFGRKRSLLATLMLMAVSTVAIGMLPTYAQAGIVAPVLLVLMRVLQGIAVGGEWGGAVLLAGEHAPEGKRTFFASFAQLGSASGLILSMLAFGAISMLPKDDLMSWGWRVPFLASAVLVVIGLYVRMRIAETPAFRAVLDRQQRVPLPLATLFARHWRSVITGALAMVICYTLFYVSSVFSLSYGVGTLHIKRPVMLGILCFAILFMALATPLSA